MKYSPTTVKDAIYAVSRNVSFFDGGGGGGIAVLICGIISGLGIGTCRSSGNGLNAVKYTCEIEFMIYYICLYDE
jgi:hypothetical protein